MLCPRRDSNCIPALENTGNSRKNKQSAPIRLMYDPGPGLKMWTLSTRFSCQDLSRSKQMPQSPNQGRSSSGNVPERSSGQSAPDASVSSTDVDSNSLNVIFPLHARRWTSPPPVRPGQRLPTRARRPGADGGRRPRWSIWSIPQRDSRPPMGAVGKSREYDLFSSPATSGKLTQGESVTRTGASVVFL